MLDLLLKADHAGSSEFHFFMGGKSNFSLQQYQSG
jgi:hypothetical protein